jgi:hypothetical protein
MFEFSGRVPEERGYAPEAIGRVPVSVYLLKKNFSHTSRSTFNRHAFCMVHISPAMAINEGEPQKMEPPLTQLVPA